MKKSFLKLLCCMFFDFNWKLSNNNTIYTTLNSFRISIRDYECINSSHIYVFDNENKTIFDIICRDKEDEEFGSNIWINKNIQILYKTLIEKNKILEKDILLLYNEMCQF